MTKMKAEISNTSITIYGLPTLQELLTYLNTLYKQYPGEYDNYHVKIQLFHPLEKGVMEAYWDAQKGKLDPNKEYFPYGTTTKEIETCMKELGIKPTP